MFNKILEKYQDKLNTMTKYPSIETYHKIGKKGKLNEELSIEIDEKDKEMIYFSEKVDGSNYRIIFYNNDYIIGSREDLLYAKGDRIINDKTGAIKKLITIAEKILETKSIPNDSLFVIYGEIYGFRIGKNYKNYSTNKNIGEFRCFDMWCMSSNKFQVTLLTNDLQQLSLWRKNENQPYFDNEEFEKYIKLFNIKKVPNVYCCPKNEIPKKLEYVYDWLCNFKRTKVGIDVQYGKSEGIVGRSKNRDFIIKIRFEDYERTLK